MRRDGPHLRRQLLTWLLGPLVLLLVLDSAAAWWSAQRFANLAYDRALQEIGREIALHVHLSGGRPRLDLPQNASKVLLTDTEDRLYFRVLAADGTLLGGDAQLPPPREARAGGLSFYGDQMGPDAVRMMVARLPVTNGASATAEAGSSTGAPAGKGRAAAAPTVLVQVAETLNKRRRLAWEAVGNVVLPQLLLIVMATAVVWFGVARGLRPLERLRRAVSDRSHLDLSPLPTDVAPGEVRPLVDEVNDLLARLGRTFDFQNRFVADAAHQLKTPVSGLKAQIELALRETDPERVRHSLAQLYISADRLSRLVRQLLSLARNEPGALDSMQLQPLDLNAFALEVSMDWVPEALKRHIDLGFEGHGQPLMIDADRDRLRELINNLIDNAIRYSQANGRVTVRLAPDDGEAGQGHCRLSISDDGRSIPVEERARIFERFHRLLGTQEDGSGLGLAIVSEIATLHRARITLEEDTDGVGNTFSVIFKLLPQPLSAG
jgi:two-component system, OmpR family, sensor histidine kinase TctE